MVTVSVSAATATSASGNAPIPSRSAAKCCTGSAAKGGGLIFQSDHSVASDVSGQTYDLIVKLVREYGRYPLRLPEEQPCNPTVS
jgi:hypothetical protein